MDNNITWQSPEPTEMENWKKKIIMDPVLSSLFNHDTSAQDFLVSKVLPLQHDHIVNLYSKLAAIKHELSHSIQKEVEAKHQLIEESYSQFMSYRKEASDTTNFEDLNESHSTLKKFNEKYETVESGLVLWKNLTSVLHYSKALETFKVNSNILKTLLRGYNGNQETINPLKVSNILRDLYHLSTKFDFSGLKVYEAEKVFIGSAKNIVHGIASKKLTKILQDSVTPEQVSTHWNQNLSKVQQWIDCLVNLGSLREFIASYFKATLTELGEKTKKVLQHNLKDLEENLQRVLMPYIASNCKCLIFFQEVLVRYRSSQQIATSNIPNLFLKFWQKMCEFVTETLAWTRREQETRNPPKTRAEVFVFKYPIIYEHCARLCQAISEFLLEKTIFNFYPFSKSQQKLMVNGLLELSRAYHRSCVESIKQLDTFIGSNYQPNTEELQEKPDQSELLVKQCQNIIILIQESRSNQIFVGLVDKFGNIICKDEGKYLDQQSKQRLKKVKQRIKQSISESPFYLEKRQLEYFRKSDNTEPRQLTMET